MLRHMKSLGGLVTFVNPPYPKWESASLYVDVACRRGMFWKWGGGSDDCDGNEKCEECRDKDQQQQQQQKQQKKKNPGCTATGMGCSRGGNEGGGAKEYKMPKNFDYSPNLDYKPRGECRTQVENVDVYAGGKKKPCDGDDEDEDKKNMSKFSLLATKVYDTLRKNWMLGSGVLLFAVGVWLLHELWVEPELDDHPRKKKKKNSLLKHPQTTSELPRTVPYVLVGGGMCSYHACKAILEADDHAKVLIISNEIYYPYRRGTLCMDVWTKDAISPRDVFFEDDSYYIDYRQLSDNASGVAVVRGWNVTNIDVKEKKVVLEDGTEIGYNKCLLATGSSPISDHVFQRASPSIQDKVIFYHDIDDFEELECAIRCGMRDVAIVGDSTAGIMLASSLTKRSKRDNFNIHLILPKSHIGNRTLPEYLNQWATRKLSQMGINVIEGSTVRKMYERNGRPVLRLSSGRSLEADSIVVTMGTAPNTLVATSSDGIHVDDESGAIRVDSQLRAAEDVWAAGSCATYQDVKSGRARHVTSSRHAQMSGRVAGNNMAGAHPADTYVYHTEEEAMLGPAVSFKAVGDVDTQLDTVGYFTVQKRASSEDGDGLGVGAGVGVGAVAGPGIVDREYNKGVVFYLCRNNLVGIVLWNMPDYMNVAQTVLSSRKSYSDLDEVASGLLHAAD